jgi:hypothetical protein
MAEEMMDGTDLRTVVLPKRVRLVPIRAPRIA